MIIMHAIPSSDDQQSKANKNVQHTFIAKTPLSSTKSKIEYPKCNWCINTDYYLRVRSVYIYCENRKRTLKVNKRTLTV